MKRLFLFLGVVSLLICAACGSNHGIVTGFIPSGNFSPASLKGQYVYQIEGFDFSTNINGVPYREIGVFNADGNGGITSATDDFTEGNLVSTTVSTGVYTLNHDGTGSLSFNNAIGTIHLAVTLVSASKVYLIEIDSNVAAGGLAEKQASTAAPTGTFVFREHDLLAAQSVASVGTFTIAGGTVSTGKVDVNAGGTFGSRTFTAGSFNVPDSTTGRGLATLTDSSPATSTFVYYVVDGNNLRLMASTLNVVGDGRAELQNGTPMLSGSYAFGSKGDSLNFLSNVNTAGRFTASGGNSITDGALDSVEVVNNATNNATNVTFTGTFAQTPDGRAALSLATTPSSNLVVWMVSPSRGFFLVNDPNTVEDGTLDLQTTAIFSNATMNGQYAFVMDGFDTGPKDRVGTLLWDGSGKLTLNEFTNVAGTSILSGTYMVSGNGRTTGSISTLSNNLVFYLISGNDAYVIQNDPFVTIVGAISKQH